MVVNICKPIKGKGYNITCDNFFTSLSIVKKLAKDKLFIVGTMRKNRRELCKKMTKPEKKATYSSEFYWHNPTNFLFVKYPACTAWQMLMQVMKRKKPEMIWFYNANKVGVDCFNQKARLYIAKSASRRWPAGVWSNILNIAAINFYVLYKKVKNKSITRRQFILMLVENLLGNPEPCQSNSNRQFRGDGEGVQKRRKCHGVCCDNKTV